MKLKIFFVIVGLIFVLAASSYMLVLTSNKVQHIEASKKVYKSLDNIIPLKQSFKKAILVYFNSECHHCQWEIETFNAEIEKLNSTQLFFISQEDECQAIDFLNSHEKIAISNYIFYKISSDKVLPTFGSEVVPQILIYNNNRLKKKYNGETKISAIVKYL